MICHEIPKFTWPFGFCFVFLFKYNLNRNPTLSQVRLAWGLNSRPPDLDLTFHVTETPAVTTRPSVTSASYVVVLNWLASTHMKELESTEMFTLGLILISVMPSGLREDIQSPVTVKTRMINSN